MPHTQKGSFSGSAAISISHRATGKRLFKSKSRSVCFKKSSHSCLFYYERVIGPLFENMVQEAEFEVCFGLEVSKGDLNPAMAFPICALRYIWSVN
jgi:hypothetical protein